ncbi:rhodanese-like domain-containing protein [Thiolinea disciformis]|uniref:rhodanese-like domain-containing protein n=1 Tax=Thiolinea disciformis TaxID=125614 RepID=UPI00037336B9|nr:rhodanese-like domain-containing protein [Thiolinea disciformis]
MSNADSLSNVFYTKPVEIVNQEKAEQILNQVRAEAQQQGLLFAGHITPLEAWQLVVSQFAVLIDVRTKEELIFVGQVPNSLHVAWATGTSLTRNPRFTRELEQKAAKDKVILLLCRSGKRSALAAEAATKAGFKHVFNISEGFEGEMNEQQQRGKRGGWRYTGLPWSQA